MEVNFASRSSTPSRRLCGGLFRWKWQLGLGCLIFAWLYSSIPLLQIRKPLANARQCSQVNPLRPSRSTEALRTMDASILSPTFQNEAIVRMSNAVQVRTETFDDMGTLEEDSRWEVFFEFAEFLRGTFPLVHQSLTVEKVNQHGLLYTWKGRNNSLKPTVLMAHQDVVPVLNSTIDQWSYAPFSGTFDGKSIWGRGSIDCKNTLVAILESIELLLIADFQPERTMVLSFGFDEEISGRLGAAHLASLLIQRYGKGGAAVVLDEGAPILRLMGRHFALPGVSEKGYADVEIRIRASGGHSSMPPPHTTIGIAAELVTVVEQEPYSAWIYDDSPLLDLLWCSAEHSSSSVMALMKYLLPGRGLTGIIEDGKRWLIPRLVAPMNPLLRFLMVTTQAVDTINGGVKFNALPEDTKVVINHRINVGESSEIIKAKLTKLALRVAAKHNLSICAFDCNDEAAESITVRFLGEVLEPAPLSPSIQYEDGRPTPWAVLAGTTRELYGEEVIVAPAIMTANTDTKYYWDLSRHIFRYFPGFDPESDPLSGIHTVDERVSVLAHIRTVQWYSLFLRNMDELETARE